MAIGTQPVTGLGDQAFAEFLTVGPDASFSAAADATVPGVGLVMRSGNALILLDYHVTDIATGMTLNQRPDAGQVTALTSMARGILAALARPAGAPPGSIAPTSPEAHYAGRRDPCRLITAATLAKYAPGAVLIPIPIPSGGGPPSSQTSACSWGSLGLINIELTLYEFPDALSARQQYQSDIQSYGQSVSGITVTGAQGLTDLGEGAVAIFQTRSGAPDVEMLVWSGNAEFQYTYGGPGARSPDRATLLAGGIAMARDGLATLANPAVWSYPHEPMYASPHDPCTLIRAATIATYLPDGTTANPSTNSQVSGVQLTSCGWIGLNSVLDLFVTVYSDPDSALSGFESDVKDSRQTKGAVTLRGGQSLTGLGEQAIALWETQNAPTVDMYVLSGNAEIELEFSDLPFDAPPMSRSTMLAADIVMAREALAAMPH